MSLADRADALDKKMADVDIDEAIRTLVLDARRRRLQVRLLAVFIALTTGLTVAIGVVSWKTAQLANLAQTNKAAVIQNCETANDSRTAQRQLWGYVLSLTPSQPRNAEQQARVDEFAKFVDRTFAPRDCQAEANIQVK